MICPRCESPEGSERLSVPLCERCLDAWWRSGLSVPGTPLVEQPKLEQWLQTGLGARRGTPYKPPAKLPHHTERKKAPYQPGPERSTQPTRLGLVDLVFRLPETQMDRLKALSARTRISRSEFLREAIADLLMKYSGSDS